MSPVATVASPVVSIPDDGARSPSSTQKVQRNTTFNVSSECYCMPVLHCTLIIVQ